ncbi:MAG: phytanoyl-CoA dioxygenase family protein [Anaerolineales bacterium]|nr:phytanoyl-CoA dioxygenase family protein [Anaerolineales bacterium]
MTPYRELTDAQAQSFLDNGYLLVTDCLAQDVAQRWIANAYTRLNYSPSDPSTWVKDIVWMDHNEQMPVAQLAPRAWNAILDVVGGVERLEPTVLEKGQGHFSSINSFNWSDAFIVNFNRGADRPWQPPSAASPGWHVDGAYFRHFLDSREQALLTIVLWSDMRHQGGGTFIAPDSVRVVARFLAAHPEGVPPNEFPYADLVGQCARFEEVTGRAGDFLILHPFMLHASSQNVLGLPRFMSNPPIVLKEHLNFNRDNPEDFSLLERATLRYLGRERLDFRPTHARQAALWTAATRPAQPGADQAY